MFEEEKFNSKRLEQWGLVATKIYLVLLFGGIPVAAMLGAIKLEVLSLNELGDFLAGAFGPLAIFWLVLGFFQQGQELRNSVDTLKLQADELKASVEQQKTMVGFTEKQLRLDIEVREEEIKRGISRELPFIQLHGGSRSSTGGKHRYRFKIRNAGATCSEGTIFLHDNDDIRLSNQAIPYVDTISEHEISLVSKEGRKLEPTEVYTLDITSQNSRGQKRFQRFEIGSGQPKLVSCDPEHY